MSILDAVVLMWTEVRPRSEIESLRRGDGIRRACAAGSNRCLTSAGALLRGLLLKAISELDQTPFAPGLSQNMHSDRHAQRSCRGRLSVSGTTTTSGVDGPERRACAPRKPRRLHGPARTPQRNRNELGETSVNKTWRKHLPQWQKSAT